MTDYEEFVNLVFKEVSDDEVDKRIRELQGLSMAFIKECKKHNVTQKEINQIKLFLDCVLEALPV